PPAPSRAPPPTAPPSIPTLPLPDALPIFHLAHRARRRRGVERALHRRDRRGVAQPGAVVDVVGAERGAEHPHHEVVPRRARHQQDRKSTRLNSSHEWISYAVFCLKKKKVM